MYGVRAAHIIVANYNPYSMTLQVRQVQKKGNFVNFIILATNICPACGLFSQVFVGDAVILIASEAFLVGVFRRQ